MDDKKFSSFFKITFGDFTEAILNIFIFFPHFFSVKTLLKTLVKPWKNLVGKKETVGFSFSEWFNRISFNLISRGIGLIMRLLLLFFYLFIQMFYLIMLPIFFLSFLILLPFRFVIFAIGKSETKKKEELREVFIKSHLLKKENIKIVESWFEKYYRFHHIDYHWWKLENLLSMPPLARDWSVGYTPTLDQYTTEMTTGAYQSKITTIIDREKEIEDIEAILSKNDEANVLIVGEEGVGKHAIIDALAQKIYEGQINPLLVYKRVLKLDLERVLTAWTDQKQRESFLETLLDEANRAKNIILMIENLDKYIVSTQDRVNLSIPFEKFGESANLNFIATSTSFNYQKFTFTNAGINGIFTKIDVKEVTKEDALQILLEKALIFELKNKVIIPYETVKNVVEKSDYFITNVPFPEKAIQLLDNACAFSIKGARVSAPVVVMPEVIDNIITETTHIPTQLSSDMKQRLIELEKRLSSRVLFQTAALKQIAATLRKSFLMIGKRKRPLATFLFLGPTGVGKTESAKALSDIFFGSEKYLIRFDMSLYQTRGDIVNLVGSIETQNPGLLTKAIRESPYGVLLLDEIEKANKDLLNIFLTILDEGYFTDGMGQRVDCKNLIIIGTSNAGSDFIYNKLKQGVQKIDDNELISYLIEKKYFTPEFLNRFDGVIAYHMLDQTMVIELGKRIIAKMIDNYSKLYKIGIKLSDQTLADTVRKGYRPEFGARDLERVITQELEDKVTKQILEGSVREGQQVSI